jgi:hypothetical protein
MIYQFRASFGENIRINTCFSWNLSRNSCSVALHVNWPLETVCSRLCNDFAAWQKFIFVARQPAGPFHSFFSWKARWLTWCFSKFLPLIPCEHFITSRASVPHLHSQSSWNTSYVLSWNSSCFKIVILLSIQLKYQLAPALHSKVWI